MIDLFYSLMGDFGNTYQDLIVFFFCSVLLVFTITSFLQFIAALFKRN